MNIDKMQFSTTKLPHPFAICLLTFALMMGGCTNFFDQVVAIDPPEYEQKLVVHCFQNQVDSSIYVSVTRNVGLLETIPDSAYNVKGASVEWYESGNLLYTMTADDFLVSPAQTGNFEWRYYGKSTNSTVITPGKQYQIKVSHPDFDPVSAVAIAPFPPKIDTVTVKLDTTTTGGFFEGTANFAITIDDPAAEVNYYEIKIRGEGPYYYGIESDDPNARDGIDYINLLVSDEFFNGKKYTIRVTNSATNEPFWVVVVKSVTFDYYKFSTTALINNDAQYNPFANPAQVFTNVTGGLGLFGLVGETQILVER